MNALAAPRGRAELIVEGEYAFTARNFAQIASLLRAHSGIALTDAKATLVYSRLAKRIRKLGLHDFDEYCALIETPAGAGERGEMLAALTTNRHQLLSRTAPFRAFAQGGRPAPDRRRQGRRARAALVGGVFKR